MTNEQLAAAVARVKELWRACHDEGEIGGEAFHEFACNDDFIMQVVNQLWEERERWRARCVAAENGHPQVKDAITQQDAIIQQQRDLMRKVRDQLNLCRPEHVTRLLIAALDAALKGGE